MHQVVDANRRKTPRRRRRRRRSLSLSRCLGDSSCCCQTLFFFILVLLHILTTPVHNTLHIVKLPSKLTLNFLVGAYILNKYTETCSLRVSLFVMSCLSHAVITNWGLVRDRIWYVFFFISYNSLYR